MFGNMMQQPLLISSLLQHAERHHGDAQVVSRRVEGDLHRYAYRDMAQRCRRLANALGTLGIEESDRVATLAWNGYRHMELYYGVSGSGAVLHTVNPRLHADPLAWILDHAGDKALFFDLSFLPLVESLRSRLKTVQHFVALADRAHMPAGSPVQGLLCYEELLEGASPDFTWPRFDENLAASLCYTSGTTGRPKGVLYSHRSTLLHSFTVALPDGMDCAARDAILPVVPMFHVNAWGLPYVACLVGAKMVLPGPRLDGESLYTLFEEEGVTITSGVPTVWQGVLDHMQKHRLKFTTLRRVGIGGAACPPSMIRTLQDTYGVSVMHGWGMTETSPMGTVGTLKRSHAHLDDEARLALQATQGRAVFGVDMKVVGADGDELPWDGKAAGELMVRGPWITEKYYATDESLLVDGWLPTGDVATISADGYMHITDRSKDLIKSGGEWISSIELENIAMAHPAVSLAACVARPDPKWGERPLLVVVRKSGADLSGDELMALYRGKVARWSAPDEVVFVDAIPIGPTGKMQKDTLRRLLEL